MVFDDRIPLIAEPGTVTPSPEREIIELFPVALWLIVSVPLWLACATGAYVNVTA